MSTATATTHTPAEALAEALAAHPGSTAAELAEVAGIGRSTAAKALAAMEHEGTARRGDGGRDGGRRLPDRWHPADDGTAVPDVAAVEDGEETPTVEPASETARASGHGEGQPVDAAAVRLGKGELRSLVLDYLADHAGPEGLGPTAVAKGLGGKSSGAVGNALARLEADGRVRLVKGSPRRYVTAG